MTASPVVLWLTMLAMPGVVQGAEDLQNWFNDPFFQISAAIPACPVPAGPYITEAERRVQSHHRAERGTSCWLSGQCEKPNFYAYDSDIASSIQAALAQHNPFANTTLWVTVQGRVVYIEGCATSPLTASKVETYMRQFPQVQQAVANLHTKMHMYPPYRLRSTP